MPATPVTDDDFEAAHAAQRRASRKALWWLAAGFALLFALLLWRVIADEAPPDLSDLRVTYTHPPDEENAYALLAKLTADLPPEPNGESAEERHFALIFEDKVAWNHEIVATLLARYPAELTDSVRVALDAPSVEAPETKSYDHTTPEVARFRSLANILARQATLAWQAGDHAKAAELNLLTLKLGNRISQSRGPLITVLTATVIENVALAGIQKHVDAKSITPGILRRYLDQLGQHEIRPDDYHAAYQLETIVFANTAKTLRGSDVAQLVDTKKTPFASAAMLPGLWQPNRTIRWHADYMRAMISESASDIPARSPAAQAKLMNHFDGVPWPRRAQNITGRVVLAIVVPTLGAVNVTCHRVRSNLRLTEVYVALRLYHHEHKGALPPTLDELVPRYLPAVPLDPFDEKPLKYSRELSTIWSIGPKTLHITNADGDLPKDLPAYRLRFARPVESRPSFVEYEAIQNGGTEPASNVSPAQAVPSDSAQAK